MLFQNHFKMLSQISSFILNLCKYQQVQSDSGIDWVRYRLFVLYYSMLLKVKNCGYRMLFQLTLCRLYCLNLSVIWCCLLLLSSFRKYLLTMARSTGKNSPCSFLCEDILGSQPIPLSSYWDRRESTWGVCHLTADARFLREQGWAGLKQPLSCANRKADAPKELQTDSSSQPLFKSLVLREKRKTMVTLPGL